MTIKQMIKVNWIRFKYKIQKLYNWKKWVHHERQTNQKWIAIDVMLTRLFNPKLAKDCDEVNECMLKQSNEDTQREAEFIKSCRRTPEKVLRGRGELMPSEIVPEFTREQKAEIAKIQKLLAKIQKLLEKPRG